MAASRSMKTRLSHYCSGLNVCRRGSVEAERQRAVPMVNSLSFSSSCTHYSSVIMELNSFKNFSFTVNMMLSFVNRGFWGSMAGRRTFSSYFWCAPPIGPLQGVCVCRPSAWQPLSVGSFVAESCPQTTAHTWTPQAACLQQLCSEPHTEGAFPQHPSLGMSVLECWGQGTSPQTIFPTPFQVLCHGF